MVTKKKKPTTSKKKKTGVKVKKSAATISYLRDTDPLNASGLCPLFQCEQRMYDPTA